MKKNMRYSDYLGTPILEGNMIVWPNRQGSSMWMNKGEVLALNSNGTITVNRWGNNGYESDRTVTLSNLNRVVIV